MQKTNIFSKAAAKIVSLILAGTLAVSAVCTGVMGNSAPVVSAQAPQASNAAAVVNTGVLLPPIL